MNCLGSFHAFRKPKFYPLGFELRRSLSRVVGTQNFQLPAFRRLPRIGQNQPKLRVMAPPLSLQAYF